MRNFVTRIAWNSKHQKFNGHYIQKWSQKHTAQSSRPAISQISDPLITLENKHFSTQNTLAIKNEIEIRAERQIWVRATRRAPNIFWRALTEYSTTLQYTLLKLSDTLHRFLDCFFDHGIQKYQHFSSVRILSIWYVKSIEFGFRLKIIVKFWEIS